METAAIVAITILLGVLVLVDVLILALVRWRASVAKVKKLTVELSQIKTRFANVVDVEEEATKVRQQLAVAQATFSDAKANHAGELAALRSGYQQRKAVYERLVKEIAIFDERLAFAEMGVYEPHFDFTDSEKYKEEIKAVREKQKGMISRKTAVFCRQQWTVDGSVAKGKTLTNRNIRLTLRAFNGECDAAIANVRWNNVNAMEKRIIRAQEQIDKLNESNAIFIAKDFLKLKLKELYLAYEYREKLKAEKEEKAELARLAREERRLIREMEEAQKDEEHYTKLLTKAKAEAASIVGPQLDAFSEQIKILEQDLAEAHAKFERAKAMAERTRCGYVYIFSNIGSFGEDVVKIGLTRRLDPSDRVRELGDASVPFTFDTHAIIYSDDAPALEASLHNEFQATRVNAQNYRKEFFRCSIDDVEAAVKKLAPDAPFFRDMEAQEYRETLSRRKLVLERSDSSAVEIFPASL